MTWRHFLVFAGIVTALWCANTVFWALTYPDATDITSMEGYR